LTRTIEQQGHAWKALLQQAEKGPVVVYFRGVSATDQALWEITWKAGQTICSLGTERQVMQALGGTDATVD
jgi:hypothetical protein